MANDEVLKDWRMRAQRAIVVCHEMDTLSRELLSIFITNPKAVSEIARIIGFLTELTITTESGLEYDAEMKRIQGLIDHD